MSNERANERILVVDNEPAVVRMCTRILAGGGYQVRGAGGGREALARLEAGDRFDLLLLDLLMPDVDGLAVLRRARELDPHVTAVIITGYGTLENAIDALRAGARGFILKPFGPDDLLPAVAQALQERRQEQENLLLRARLPILEISQTLMAGEDVASLARRLLAIVTRQVRADRASLMLLDEQEDELYIASAIGLPAEVVDVAQVSVGQGIAGRALLLEEPLVLDEEADLEPSLRALLVRPDIIQGPSEAERALDIAAAVCVPLRTRKRAIGVLNVSRAKRAGGKPFTPGDVNLLSIMGGQIATALDNAQLFETVARGKREWEATFDAIADGIAFVDADFRIVRINSTLARWLGTTPQALVGRICYEAIHQSNAPIESCTHLKAMQSGQPQSIEMELSALEGTFLVSSYPLRDERGEAMASVHVLKDITGEKQLQASLIQTEKLAALGRLAASLAHEINNPLQALRSGLRLLVTRRSLEEEKRQRYLEVASREVERLIGIVDRMLNFYRPAAEQLEPTDVNAVVDETLALADKRLQHGRVAVWPKLAADLPPVDAVAGQLKQVFLNIIINALDAMPDGGKLAVETGWDGNRREVWISFADTGEGIPAEEISHIFEPFYTRKLKGTGLGLAISFGIVERHRGRIEVESQVDEGSTFTVFLPVSS